MRVSRYNISGGTLYVAVLAVIGVGFTTGIAQQVVIGTELSPFSLFGGFISLEQTGMPADSFSYRYLQQGGFTLRQAFRNGLDGTFSYRLQGIALKSTSILNVHSQT